MIRLITHSWILMWNVKRNTLMELKRVCGKKQGWCLRLNMEVSSNATSTLTFHISMWNSSFCASGNVLFGVLVFFSFCQVVCFKERQMMMINSISTTQLWNWSSLQKNCQLSSYVQRLLIKSFILISIKNIVERKPLLRILHVQTKFCQIAFQPPHPTLKQTDAFWHVFYCQKFANYLEQRFVHFGKVIKW